MSPKVLYPLCFGAGVGIVLLVCGLAFGDHELRTIGLSVLTAAVVHAGIGYQVAP